MDDGSTDDAKGRVKEATGSLTGDDSLKNEGKADRTSASAKDKVDKVTDKAKDLLNRKNKR